MNTCTTPQASAMTRNTYSRRVRVTAMRTRPQSRRNASVRSDVPASDGAETLATCTNIVLPLLNVAPVRDVNGERRPSQAPVIQARATRAARPPESRCIQPIVLEPWEAPIDPVWRRLRPEGDQPVGVTVDDPPCGRAADGGHSGRAEGAP